MAFSPKTYLLEKTVPLDRETVWQLLSDTDVLNRFIGLFPVVFSSAKKLNNEVFFREAHAKVLGVIPLSWKELPFEWIQNERYSVERHYLTGPLKHFVGGVELIDSETLLEDGQPETTVRLFSRFTPRNVLGLAAIPINGLGSMKKTFAYLENCLTHTQKKNTDLLSAAQSDVNAKDLQEMIKNLGSMPVSKTHVTLLYNYLANRPDYDVAEIKPFVVAKEWQVDPDEVLRLFLYATKAGLVNLSWNMICPNCRVSKDSYQSLTDLDARFHCDLCGINYDANFDRYVELTFSVHPSVRKAYSSIYCVGGPRLTPHVLVQKIITKGTTGTLMLPNSDAALRLRVLQANHILPVTSTTNQISTEIEYEDGGWTQKGLFINPMTLEIIINNSSSSDLVVVVEKTDWSNETVTAAKVTAMQEFRDLFSSEVLAPGQQVGIENVTILFSDLQGSTFLYETIGDANAYGRVRKHFDFLKLWIGRHNGSIVKTIGDAVMAVFSRPEDALNAGLSIQKNVAGFNLETASDIVLKLGLHSGPAISVNSNDLLDYFGRTVNIAARIQAQSSGDDIVLSRDDFEKQTIQSIIASESVRTESYPAVLKGIEGSVELVRIRLASGLVDDKSLPQIHIKAPE